MKETIESCPPRLKEYTFLLKKRELGHRFPLFVERIDHELLERFGKTRRIFDLHLQQQSDALLLSLSGISDEESLDFVWGTSCHINTPDDFLFLEKEVDTFLERTQPLGISHAITLANQGSFYLFFVYRGPRKGKENRFCFRISDNPDMKYVFHPKTKQVVSHLRCKKKENVLHSMESFSFRIAHKLFFGNFFLLSGGNV